MKNESKMQFCLFASLPFFAQTRKNKRLCDIFVKQTKSFIRFFVNDSFKTPSVIISK